VGNPEREIPVVKPRPKLVDNIKIYLRETE
jgi:hypothetical protein